MRIHSRAGATAGLTSDRANADMDVVAADPFSNRLGTVLVREGLIKQRDVSAIAQHQAATGSSFGEAAVDLGLLREDELAVALERQSEGSAADMTAARLDPQIVAAGDLNDPYVVRVRAIRSRLLRDQPQRDGRRLSSCALIGIDCQEELAVLAANLAVVFVRMHTPTLLIDGGQQRARQQELFRLPPVPTEDVPALNSLVAQPSGIDNLWIASLHAGEHDTSYEREPICSRVAKWQVPGTQVIATLPLDEGSSTAMVAAAVEGLDTVVLLARRNRSRVADLRALIDSLDAQHVAISGTVLV